MAIAFNCPHCGESYRLKDELGGKRVNCRKASCRKTFTVPVQAAVSANVPPVDLEALAAAALLEGPAAEEKPKGPQGKIKATCPMCDHVWEVDRALEGKNVPCPECKKIVKVPVLKEAKPADWRKAGSGRPSLAKNEEKLEGAWDTERKYASAGTLEAAGAIEVEEEEPERGATLRRIRKWMLIAAGVAGLAFGVIWLVKERKEVKREHSIADAVKEVESEESLKKRPLFQGAILRAAGEYKVRSIQNREDLAEATRTLTNAVNKVNEAKSSAERDGLLIDIALQMTSLGGTQQEIDQKRRNTWPDVQKDIRQTMAKLSADRDLRLLALRRLARALIDKKQPDMPVNVAREIMREDIAEVIGQTALELILADQKDAAKQLLEGAVAALSATPEQAATAPSLTAARIALGGEQPLPLGKLPLAPNVAGQLQDVTRIAYAEGLAAQGKFDQARQMAEQPGNPEARVRALIAIANVALAKKPDQAGPAAEAAAKIVTQEMKSSPPPGWVVVRLVSMAARAGRVEAAKSAAESIKDEATQSWAKLEIFRARLKLQRDQAVPESWFEELGDAKTPRVTHSLAREAMARQNTKVGESGLSKTVDGWPQGTMRPFGHAGITLGKQDRADGR